MALIRFTDTDGFVLDLGQLFFTEKTGDPAVLDAAGLTLIASRTDSDIMIKGDPTAPSSAELSFDLNQRNNLDLRNNRTGKVIITAAAQGSIKIAIVGSGLPDAVEFQLTVGVEIKVNLTAPGSTFTMVDGCSGNNILVFCPVKPVFGALALDKNSCKWIDSDGVVHHLGNA